MARTNNRNRKVYGRAKRLEMARSVLPSTSRQHAREALAAVRRTSRRAIARDLRRYTGAAEDATDRYDHDGLDLARYPNDEIKEIVCDRRSADKLGSFQRWAVETTRHLPVEERLEAVRDVLPRDLIGRHALSHVRAMKEFRWMDHDYWWWGRDTAADDAAERERVVVVVRRLLAQGRHREVNATMRANAGASPWYPDPPGPGWQRDRHGGWYRALSGAHDVETFVDEVLVNRYCCRNQAVALRRLAGEIR